MGRSESCVAIGLFEGRKSPIDAQAFFSYLLRGVGQPFGQKQRLCLPVHAVDGAANVGGCGEMKCIRAETACYQGVFRQLQENAPLIGRDDVSIEAK